MPILKSTANQSHRVWKNYELKIFIHLLEQLKIESLNSSNLIERDWYWLQLSILHSLARETWTRQWRKLRRTLAHTRCLSWWIRWGKVPSSYVWPWATFIKKLWNLLQTAWGQISPERCFATAVESPSDEFPGVILCFLEIFCNDSGGLWGGNILIRMKKF